ncbi:BrnT family toxin [Candidatus Daviesbacteria bacterium]|nr:BrnT family toxin [Candidatus Daviesbacteria bacterium]
MRTDKDVFEFEWNNGNSGKNKKHKVEDKEAEEVFFDENKVTFPDSLHSTDNEERLRIIGKTKKGRLLFIVFTKRGQKIRIISARDINRKEVPLYEKTA